MTHIINTNENISQYIKDEQCKIYKKKLHFKVGSSTQIYYFILKENELIDILWEEESGEISAEHISHDNAELVVYKVVNYSYDRYFSVHKNQCIEYILNKEVTANSEVGLFFCKSIEEAKRGNFEGVINKAELKAKVYIDDLVGCNSRDVQFSRCIPLEVLLIDFNK